MNQPQIIYYDGVELHVTWDAYIKSPLDDGSLWLGMWSPINYSITIDTRCSKTYQLSILLHELLHAFLTINVIQLDDDADDEDFIVSRLGHGLIQIFQDPRNVWLTKFLNFDKVDNSLAFYNSKVLYYDGIEITVIWTFPVVKKDDQATMLDGMFYPIDCQMLINNHLAIHQQRIVLIKQLLFTIISLGNIKIASTISGKDFISKRIAHSFLQVCYDPRNKWLLEHIGLITSENKTKKSKKRITKTTRKAG